MRLTLSPMLNTKNKASNGFIRDGVIDFPKVRSQCPLRRSIGL